MNALTLIYYMSGPMQYACLAGTLCCLSSGIFALSFVGFSLKTGAGGYTVGVQEVASLGFLGPEVIGETLGLSARVALALRVSVFLATLDHSWPRTPQDLATVSLA